MAASGLRRMGVIDQRQNSRSAVASGAAIVKNEIQAHMQVGVSGLLDEVLAHIYAGSRVWALRHIT